MTKPNHILTTQPNKPDRIHALTDSLIIGLVLVGVKQAVFASQFSVRRAGFDLRCHAGGHTYLLWKR